VSRPSGLAGTHRRWHTARGIKSKMCPLCVAHPIPRPPPRRVKRHRVKRRLALRPEEIAALEQFVQRLELADPASRQFRGLVEMLTAFLKGLLG